MWLGCTALEISSIRFLIKMLGAAHTGMLVLKTKTLALKTKTLAKMASCAFGQAIMYTRIDLCQLWMEV